MNNDLEHQCTQLLFWSWGHEVRGKMATIKDIVFLIKKLLSDPDLDRDQVFPLLDKIDQIGEKVGATIASPHEVAVISLHELIEICIKRWETIEPNNPITFHSALHPSQPYIRANSAWLERVLDIIIENAAEAMRHSDNKSIHIVTVADEHNVTVAVRDNGRRIDKQSLADIFHKPLELPGGRGRGLYIACLAVEHYGGKIEVASNPEEGTRITVRFPLVSEGTANA